MLSLGIPMDVSLHVSSIATAQAARTLEWQKVKMESAASLSLRRGRTAPPEAEIALQDVARLRDQVHRGRERLFHASVSITIYADGAEQLKERELALRGLFAGALASLDRLAFRQHEGHLSTLPLAMNAIAAWRTLDTTSVAMLMPFAPPDLDTRKGHPVRPRPALRVSRDLRRLRRGLPQRQHRGDGAERRGQVLLDEVGPAEGHHRAGSSTTSSTRRASTPP